MRLTGTESTGWEQTLDEYIKALQHHDYMEKRSTSARDPFLATGEYAIDNYVLKSYIGDKFDKYPKLETSVSLRAWEDVKSKGCESICGTRYDNIQKTWWSKFKERIILAAVGGAFLIGPMWIMVLLSGPFSSLICTTACVAGFGILISYYLEDGKDVLGSTAAYAAVLIVFVGTSSS
ncbi:hypothetical protein CMQ_3533 [Grosmannia clavigera kw1407]|uniref:DUF6594 domain-containing protein n=1 Tax=Grosmannia clavigera (strain kw1407 / UAMH 11150) TaxID=655863 RepID=F0XAU3_GROCL|nr:uncharacterized protein CMQ_3533 [Grosmannia clavigera kw1407]EFX05464.1 hypothetical protein CMQ_3533 [Grosmannia clavigera kw1407]